MTLGEIWDPFGMISDWIWDDAGMISDCVLAHYTFGILLASVWDECGMKCDQISRTVEPPLKPLGSIRRIKLKPVGAPS